MFDSLTAVEYAMLLQKISRARQIWHFAHYRMIGSTCLGQQEVADMYHELADVTNWICGLG